MEEAKVGSFPLFFLSYVTDVGAVGSTNTSKPQKLSYKKIDYLFKDTFYYSELEQVFH